MGTSEISLLEPLEKVLNTAARNLAANMGGDTMFETIRSSFLSNALDIQARIGSPSVSTIEDAVRVLGEEYSERSRVVLCMRDYRRREAAEKH